MTEPTDLWGLWSDEEGWAYARYGLLTTDDKAIGESWVTTWPGYRPVQLVPAGSERSAIVRRLRERVAKIIRVRETHRTGADFWLILEGKRMELESLIRELEASEEPRR